MVKYRYPVEHAGYLAQVADVDSSVVQAVSQGHSVHRGRTKTKTPIEQIMIFAIQNRYTLSCLYKMGSIDCELIHAILQMLFDK